MQQTPEQALRAYEAALSTYDWVQIAPFIHPDACFVFSSGTHLGREAIGEAVRRVFTIIRDEQYRISELQWVMQTPSFATCVYRFEWCGVIDGQPASGAGRGTCVLVCQDQRWLLLNEHLGPLPE